MKTVRHSAWTLLIAHFAMLGYAQTKCPTTEDTTLPVPTITAVDASKSTVSGSVPAGADKKIPSGTVLVCVNGVQTAAPTSITGNGDFGAIAISMKPGQQLTAIYLPPPESTGGQAYSAPSGGWLVGGCSKDVSPNASLKAPSLSVTVDKSTNEASYTGNVSGASSGSVRICVNDLPQQGQVVQIGSDGSFKASTAFKVSAGDKITAQAFSGSTPIYGPVTAAPQVITNGPLQVGSAPAKTGNPSTLTMIGGVEQAGYSSLSQSTNAFLNAFVAGPQDRPVIGWGRIRLLSAPQPSTQGIVSVFTDPTGQLTTQDYTKVGQALDFVAGPQVRVPFTKYWSLIADGGVTTPLNSQTVALTYVVPAPGTTECSTLVSRFSVKNGYHPGLTQAPAGSSTCLAGGYTNVAFSNQDRSSFLVKYGGGFRTTNLINVDCSGQSCTPSNGVLDITIGQDASVTRGLLRHAIFKLDGFVPIPTGNTSFVYFFGSAYVRLAKNQDYSPLILQTATGVTVPSSTVIVLPLLQPDRDFYRLGVGLSINQIFCKMFNTTCPSKTSGSTTGSAAAKE